MNLGVSQSEDKSCSVSLVVQQRLPLYLLPGVSRVTRL